MVTEEFKKEVEYARKIARIRDIAEKELPCCDFENVFIKSSPRVHCYEGIKITLIGCPKLDAIDYSVKLSEILKNSDIKDITVLKMEVPCCGGLEYAVGKALEKSQEEIELKVLTVTVDGRLC